MLRSHYVVAAVAVLTLFLLGVAQMPAGRYIRAAIGLTAQPETYLELYFTQPDLLPERLPFGGATLTVPVTLANRSPETTDVTWVMRQHRDGVAGAPQVLSQGTQPLGPMSRESADATGFVVCENERVKVEIAVPAMATSIDFWVTCEVLNTGGE